MTPTNQIPEEISEIMSYLSYTFAKSMKDPIQDKSDLYNDLVVLYLENLDSGKVDPKDKDQWFVFFKSRLTNKYNRLLNERKIIDKFAKESQS